MAFLISCCRPWRRRPQLRCSHRTREQQVQMLFSPCHVPQLIFSLLLWTLPYRRHGSGQQQDFCSGSSSRLSEGNSSCPPKEKTKTDYVLLLHHVYIIFGPPGQYCPQQNDIFASWPLAEKTLLALRAKVQLKIQPENTTRLMNPCYWQMVYWCDLRYILQVLHQLQFQVSAMKNSHSMSR